ncbi:MAG: 2Fe-2S iron-sulfur cluster binding domain-containing protein [Planctomycetes bacterium]|nr:2Fe-2S iron-sulfur cluster binding domain-containing protein [Planctomycetota bacterium]
MGGVNPYIRKVPLNRPTMPFTVTFIDEETNTSKSYVMDPSKFPYGHIGLDGSLLAIAEEAGVEINHSCGGVCACSTCHVYVRDGSGSCSKATENEEDELDKAPALTTESRLSCQCVPDGSADVVVVIPKWNRNQVSEGH